MQILLTNYYEQTPSIFTYLELYATAEVTRKTKCHHPKWVSEVYHYYTEHIITIQACTTTKRIITIQACLTNKRIIIIHGNIDSLCLISQRNIS